MSYRTFAARGLLASALALLASPCWARPDALAAPARARVADASRRMDWNRVNLLVANDGRFPYDAAGGTSGALYPRGAGLPLLFASGLWLGGTVGGLARVTVAEYESEFAPGGMPGGVPDDPSAPQHVVYKVARWSGDPRDTAHVERTASELAADPKLDPLAHHSWSEYMAGAAPHGAPWRVHRLPDTSTPAAGDSVDVPGPDVLGERMLWCVYNDANVSRHVAAPGSTAPLGVEVRQAVFAYDRPGPLGSAVFVRYEVRNRGANTIPDLRTAFWSDPDVGADFQDDLAGCDTLRSLALAYNTPWGADPAHGWAKPAVGFDLLASDFGQAPTGPDRFAAFVEYVNGADPAHPSESWNLMCGLQRDGTPFTDPYFQVTTPYWYAGDPVLRTYGFDPQPSNEKVLVTAGPRAFAPGDTAVFWVALLVGQGGSPAASLAALRCASDDAQLAFDAGFAEPFAAPGYCVSAVNDCPRGADWWAANVTALTAFTASQWADIAAWTDSLSAKLFRFPGLGGYATILATRHGTARDSARREYLALLSNVVAGEVLGLVPADGVAARLSRTTGVLAPPLAGGTVGELIGWAPVARGLVEARYENDVDLHRRALEGAPVGLPQFGGGAGPAAFGMGSALDPLVAPDSFPTVLLRFGAGQQAYRYLRLETALGAEPAGGRAYRYGGHRFVPLTAWDLHSGVQLELAFAERAVTLDDGTLVPPWSQPPSFDSTWAPTPAADGGLERLWVLARPYRATPRAEFAADGVPLAGAWPALYQLDARRRAALDVVDDGDGFRFVAGWPATPSAEGLLHALESAAPADSEAAALRSRTAEALRGVNLGYGLGPLCVRAAPFEVTLVEAAASDGRVRLRWRLGGPTRSARLERRSRWGVWLDGGAAVPEPGGTVLADFGEPEAGRWAYRLAFETAIGFARSDSVWIDLPSSSAPALAVTGVWPNPAAGFARVSFTLPAGGTAKLEVYDLGGRRAYARDLGALPAGLHHVEIAPGRRLRPGVWFVVLRFGGERRTARFVAL